MHRALVRHRPYLPPSSESQIRTMERAEIRGEYQELYMKMNEEARTEWMDGSIDGLAEDRTDTWPL